MPPETNLNLQENMTSLTPQHFYRASNVLEHQDSIGFLSHFTKDYGTTLRTITDHEVSTKIGVRYWGNATLNT